MNYSKYQLDIFNFFRRGIESPHAICPAGPGSGKTTTIVHGVKHVPPGASCFVGSFNRHIADNLKGKVSPHISDTLNAMGNKACRGMRLDKFKTRNILKRLFSEENEFKKFINPTERVIGLLKANIIHPNDLDGNVDEIINLHGIDVPNGYNFNEIIKNVFTDSYNDSRTIDFDDQKYFPIMYDLPLPTFDFLCIDEAQDLSPLDTELCKRMIKGFSIFVGDEWQCQPTGTMVDVVKVKTEWNDLLVEKKPIEELSKGMVVVSYDRLNNDWKRNKQITEIAYRPYNDNLIVVKTETGNISKYTPNHKCYIHFKDLRENWCIYLMRKGDDFRIGKTKINRGRTGTGLTRRLWDQQADAIWILELYDSNREAYLQEQIISGKYGISQSIFKVGTNTRLTQNEINYLWLIIGNNKEQAIKCLKDFGRDIKYPILKKNEIWKFGVILTQACNIMDGCRVLPYNHGSDLFNIKNNNLNRSLLNEWVSVTVSKEHYNGLVYSLNIDQDHTYIADGIVTGNSVYGFRGSSPDSMNNIQKEFNSIELLLPICYRCPDSVIDELQKINPGVERPVPNPNGQGIVDTIKKDQFYKIVMENDFVLCRTTAPLVKECLRFLGEGRYAYVRGRDIGQGLINLIDKIELNNCSIKTFDHKLDQYFHTEKTRLENLGREYQLGMLEDQYESLKAIEVRCTNVVGLRNLIEDMIPANEIGKGICFMSIHRAKGLETKNVFLLRPDQIPHARSKLDWQLKQETNLKFIAISRAQYAFYYILKDIDEK